MLKLGDVIHNQRTANGITLRKLAELTGLSAMYISEIENNKKAPTKVDTLKRIGDALGIQHTKLLFLAYQSQLKSGEPVVEDDPRVAVARTVMDPSTSVSKIEEIKRILETT